jgi:curli biogenesis system outer membrane secretion channel CsgG
MDRMTLDTAIPHRITAALALVAATLALAACGTTSSLEAPAERAAIDLTPYSRLIVEDFKDAATGKMKPEARPLLEPKVAEATRMFPEQIASVVKAGGGFDEVLRTGAPDAQTLVLRGTITQYDPGNAALQLLVGFGAGTANFNSTLQLVDGGTGNVLGTWNVDKNSWALGGMIAASQKPEDFMQEAARKIGTELSDRRKAGSIKKPAD